MLEGKPLKQIFLFSLPLMFGNIFQQLYTVADTAIVGKGVGLSALAALGTIDWLCWMFLAIIQGFTMGFGVRMSQKFGQGDIEGLRRTVGLSARFSVFIAIAGTGIGELGVPLFLRMLHVSAELKPLAALYIRIAFGGIPAIVFFNFCSSALRSIGDSRTPFAAMVTAAITNILLDCLTVFVLGWGIAGAAAATVFSELISGMICALRLCKTSELHFSRAHMLPDRKSGGELWRLGTPLALANAIIAIGGMSVQTVVNGFSLSFIAGFTATNKLYGLLEIAALSYGYGVTTYVGQNYGAGQYDRIRSGMRSALLLSVGTSLLIMTVMILFGRPVTMLFIASEDAALAAAAGDTAYHYLFVMSVFLPVLYPLYAWRAALQGMGNTIIPMAASILELLFRVGVAISIAHTGAEEWIFAAEPAAWISGATLLAVSFYHRISREENKSIGR